MNLAWDVMVIMMAIALCIGLGTVVMVVVSLLKGVPGD